MEYNGLTKDEYIRLLKECNMTTQKWTPGRLKRFEERLKEIIRGRNRKK